VQPLQRTASPLVTLITADELALQPRGHLGRNYELPQALGETNQRLFAPTPFGQGRST